MRTRDHQHRRWARRWVAGALGGALLLGALGSQAVPPPPPMLLRADPLGRALKARAPPEAPAEAVESAARPGDEPGAGPALIWLFPMAGQLSGAPNLGE